MYPCKFVDIQVLVQVNAFELVFIAGARFDKFIINHHMAILLMMINNRRTFDDDQTLD